MVELEISPIPDSESRTTPNQKSFNSTLPAKQASKNSLKSQDHREENNNDTLRPSPNAKVDGYFDYVRATTNTPSPLSSPVPRDDFPNNDGSSSAGDGPSVKFHNNVTRPDAGALKTDDSSDTETNNTPKRSGRRLGRPPVRVFRGSFQTKSPTGTSSLFASLKKPSSVRSTDGLASDTEPYLNGDDRIGVASSSEQLASDSEAPNNRSTPALAHPYRLSASKRSKSEASVAQVRKPWRQRSKYLSRSVDLRKGLDSGASGDEMDPQVHSDTEAHDELGELSGNETNHAKPKRRFRYVRSNTMGDLFSGSSGAGGNSQSNGGKIFKRRISAFNADNASGATWKDLKNTLRMNFGIRKKKEAAVPEIDYEKSTELINELFAGVPAAIIAGSTFLRDEKGLKRIPVLLEQIKFRLTDVTGTLREKNRKYKLELEYGSGPARLTWTIYRHRKDFIVLHNQFKSTRFQASRIFGDNTKLPKLPSRNHYMPPNRRLSAISTRLGPVASFREGSNTPGRRHSLTSSNDQAIPNIDEVLSSRQSSRPSSRRSSLISSVSSNSSRLSEALAPTRSRMERERQARSEAKAHAYAQLQKGMELYLKTLFQMYRFDSEANRIFQFLELSNMSIRLAPENTFRGKEGYLFVRSSSAVQGWRVTHWRPNDFSQMISRHTPKWFMVRHSYIVCVENIYETNILEVFLVDSGFRVSHGKIGDPDEQGDLSDDQLSDSGRAGHSKMTPGQVHLSLQLENNERTLKLLPTSGDKTLHSWLDSIQQMKEQTIWSRKQRFNSFAPVRQHAHCRWFVDGRDYYWAVSEAISSARDVIYILDWWLSPELYMRRPPETNQEWRLDRLLKRKAEEGVKIFVIVYRNVGQTIPIDSMYTKHSLLDLHPNIYVMRSPNQLLQNTFFWAHHEKLCLIDHSIAFVGGLDLCYGRWDTPSHVLNDDKPYAFYPPGTKRFDGTQLWPGKDYSNPRVSDFFELDRPYESMYDRNNVPRMPWHDVHMMVVGQPARDLVRHFVQRWNYVLRQKRPSRYTPLLLPPPDLTDEQIRQLNFDGTCEIQVLRSSGPWSLGLKQTEHSIQNAYIKAIEQSEHFVYIENQFFVTSTMLENAKIENRIGDALVERIMRAHENGENWRAVIIIPLMPGFESQVDLPDGSSVRMIMQCQYFSISRGSNSIFSRLMQAGIEPDDYIQFYSLRKWGKIGPNKKLVTEQLYIHAKTMVVDDRVAIIGSANINERSMRGNRDSEVACIVRDAFQMDSMMGGQQYQVGHFAHTLRIRLMREHLGVDIDQLSIVDAEASKLDYVEYEDGSRRLTRRVEKDGEPLRPDDDRRPSAAGEDEGHNFTMPTEAIEMRGFNHFAGIDNIGLRDKKAFSTDSRIQGNTRHRADVEGKGDDGWKIPGRVKKDRLKGKEKETVNGINDNVSNIVDEILESDVDDILKFKRKLYERLCGVSLLKIDQFEVEVDATDGGDVNGSLSGHSANSVLDGIANGDLPKAIDPWAFEDPLNETFFYDFWQRIAQRNTSLYRQVFRCQPDDEVQTWKQYKEYVRYGEKFSKAQDDVSEDSGPVSHAPLGDVADDASDEQEHVQENGSGSNGHGAIDNDIFDVEDEDSEERKSEERNASRQPSSHFGHAQSSKPPYRRRRRANTRSSRRAIGDINHIPDAGEAEANLKGIMGHLVLFPTDWLSREWESGNWFYNLDRIPPVEIYD